VHQQAQLLVEDSANDIALGVAKTRQLIDRDHVDFIFGNVNSAVALVMTRVTAEKRKLHIVTGGHVDDITGSRCSNVFRICKTTTMEPTRMATVRLCDLPLQSLLMSRKNCSAWAIVGTMRSVAECYDTGSTWETGMI
jgi:hypothetical protein